MFRRALMVAALLSLPALASERRLSYTYESHVLSPGKMELEPWITLRTGRDSFYVRADQRLEFEIGVVEGLQTALYVNAKGVLQGTGAERVGSYEWTGISNEWKYKLFDPVADAVGLALYGEVTGGPEEWELEGKLILDKRLGNLLLAANVVGEHEWVFEGGGMETEVILELDAGAAWLLNNGLSLGVEIRNHNEWVGGEYEHSALFLGPAISWSTEPFWFSLSVLPQVFSPHGASHEALVLDEHERLETRLLLGFHL